MRFSPATVLLATFIGAGALVSGARAADPAKIDASAQVDKFSPANPDTTKTVNRIDSKRDDRVQDSRAALAGLIDEPTAAIADHRAPIDVTETRDKNMIDRKDAPQTGKTFDTKTSPLNGAAAGGQFQPQGNAFHSSGSSAGAEKFQQGLRDAGSSPYAQHSELGRQTSFDQLNRFVFKRNGPGSEDGAALVTAAGGGQSTVLPTSSSGAVRSPASTGADGSGGLQVMGVFGSRPAGK